MWEIIGKFGLSNPKEVLKCERALVALGSFQQISHLFLNCLLAIHEKFLVFYRKFWIYFGFLRSIHGQDSALNQPPQGNPSDSGDSMDL